MVKFKVDDSNYNKIYPIGSIYMSINETNPSELFGGEWEQIKDTFLLACGTKYQNGATGGSATVTLTENQMPSHTHIQDSHNHTQNSHNHTQNPHSHMPQSGRAFVTQINTYTGNIGENNVQSGSNYRVPTINSKDNWYGSEYTGNITATNNSATATNQSATATNQNTGGGQAHENMPPYLAVFVWVRIA